MTAERQRIEVRGVVQGVGFRPFVARLATELGLAGAVSNDETGVVIEVEGPGPLLTEFAARLRLDAPPLASVLSVTSRAGTPSGEREFRIVAGTPAAGARTLVPADVATCADCLREMRDPADRRYRHPFITCTNCGPRFTIVTDLPYDRPNTTMARFDMCAACAAEYANPDDRRYHAQPISCHNCGPRLRFVHDGNTARGEDAVAAARELLRSGRILAVKGIGGFHLACDATDAHAVARLRDRKHRPDKPFAVMARDLRTAALAVGLDAAGERALTAPARPVVLLPRRPGSGVADPVAPGLAELGVLLPYAPVHHLLFAGTEFHFLVMTSGNLSDEPLCYDDEDALSRLDGLADGFLLHDRPIATPGEDSVVTSETPIRRSRGYAPLPVALPDRGPVVLAVGAEVKNTFCVTREELAFCSAHNGDVGTLESRTAFGRAVEHVLALHAVRPEALVADAHPGYVTRSWAEQRAAETGVPLISVQHHHAHLASLLAEHGRVGTPAVGVVFDGTGYGCDQHVWGGEILGVGENIAEFERLAHLAEFPLAGGDRAVRNPYRVALALTGGAWRPDGIDPAEVDVVLAQLRTGVGCVPTTSVGRLFDGVAALLGVRARVTYEAQAAIELEALARTATRAAPLEFSRLSHRTLVRGILAAVANGHDRAELALGFHHALAAGTADVVVELAAARGVRTVGLSGGVFQNRLLLALLAGALREAGLTVLTHAVVPPNDGGLCLGQAVVGRAVLREKGER
ncbi:carbamoyltransferase HypF [Cryptosporangium sp. NPDC051539]|uniref:carbamoyltransferase HypF n=1 Tax=Cryptosporangium sp. NPDC051539 TaxID=3363962 RepID=UPI0037B50B65